MVLFFILALFSALLMVYFLVVVQGFVVSFAAVLMPILTVKILVLVSQNTLLELLVLAFVLHIFSDISAVVAGLLVLTLLSDTALYHLNLKSAFPLAPFVLVLTMVLCLSRPSGPPS